MPELNQETCPKCQMPKQAKTSGSLTQWISICKCDTLFQPEDTQDTQSSSIDMCSTCGKRIEAGRAGSLTQWIFRADLCTCDGAARKMQDAIASAEADFGGDADSGSLIRNRASGPHRAMRTAEINEAAAYEKLCELPELKVDQASFPVERYGPHKILGQGASGCVYLCIDRLLKKRVAVKVLHSLTTEQLIAFQREAKATSQLSHEGIVKVLDFGATADGYPFMVMEYIEGTSLDNLIEEHGPLETYDGVCIISQMCNALSYAHERGVYHRDIKPSNVIVIEDRTRKMHARLIDFGVGEFKSEQVDVDSQGKTLVGTPSYMSPDQALGLPFDSRCEVYSLGCLLFKTLTGEPPFTGTTPLETIAMHANAPVPALSDRNPEGVFPLELEGVISRCLSKSQADRFQTMDELGEALADLEDVIEVSSRIETVEAEIEEVSSSVNKKKTKKLVLLLVLCSAAIIAGFGFIVMSMRKEAPSLKKIPKAVALANVFDKTDQKRWIQDRGEYGPQWSTTSATTDADFKKLRNKDVQAVSIGITESVTGTGFKYLKNEPIKFINCQASPLSEEGLRAISEIKTLEYLRISVATNITAEGLRCLRSLPRLEGLDLLVSKLPIEAPEIIAEIPNLDCISFFNSVPLDYKRLGALRKLRRLYFLDLSGTGLDSKAIPTIAKINQIRELRLSDNNITDENLELLSRIPLFQLRLGKTNVTDSGILKLTKMKQLKVLLLDYCPNITARGVLKLRTAMPNLKVVFNERGDDDASSLDTMFQQ